MATPVLTAEAVEGSTYVVTLTFSDETANAVTPDTLVWSLYDEDGAIVNGRDGVTVTPELETNIVLSGADLAAGNGALREKRVLGITGTYSSDLGNGLPLRDEAIFYLRETVGG